VSKWKNQILSLGISLMIGLVLGAGLLFIFAAVLKGRETPAVLLQPMAFLPAALGALASAFIAAKKIGENGLVYGSICGLLLFCCFLAAAMAVAGLPIGLGALIKCVICILCGCIGGVLGVNTGKKVKF